MRGQYKVRRGTSIAAAALSFALVAPLAQPVAFAQEKPASVQTTETAIESEGFGKFAVYHLGFCS
ncbi:hypothetical protein [uncultured Corynebacterium sp.]|uniref:hypothetical protein n=1 Tax=uncultured Corynebacterium sp. TaxID=159447 RepID=UPI00288B0F26|nr:hypothetical protein [uncultured Corynebacterium sp.]